MNVPAEQLECGAEAWTALIRTVRLSLADFNLEQLEELATRAQAMLLSSSDPLVDRACIATEQRMLGELLASTRANLALVRRLSPGGSESQWGR